MNEVFIPVKGYETKYQISNLGRVKSLPKGDGNGNRERILKTDATDMKCGVYHRVTFSVNGTTSRFSVHRLVAQHFIPNPENKPFVNHKDNNPSNNKVDNLEWCTHSENMVHAERQGRLFKTQSAGGKAAGVKQIAAFDKRMSDLLGEAFLGSVKHITSSGRVGHRRVVYRCNCCGDRSTDQYDSHAIKKRKGVCRPCYIKHFKE